MAMVESADSSDARVIRLSPNRSATIDQIKANYFLLAAFALIVAVGWAIFGVWLVFFFAGLELILLAFLLSKTYFKSQVSQIITLNTATITVEDIACDVRAQRCLSRPNAKLSVSRFEKPLLTEQLFLYDHQQRVEIGQFLNRTDKLQLVQYCSDVGVPVRDHIDCIRSM